MKRLFYILVFIPLLVGCVKTREIVKYVDRPVEVIKPYPVYVRPDSTYVMTITEVWHNHRDFRKGLTTQTEVIQATLAELRWRRLFIEGILGYLNSFYERPVEGPTTAMP